MSKIAFIDLEIGGRGKILDAGGVVGDMQMHTGRIPEFLNFISDCDVLVGHNIVNHDYKYLEPLLRREYPLIDTLYWSPLLFPQKPYHRLLKDDKLQTDEINNPLNDALKAKILFEDELREFRKLSKEWQQLFYDLLGRDPHFSRMFQYAGFDRDWRPTFLRKSLEDRLKELLRGKICINADIDRQIREHRVECAYAAALINADDRYSITPPWVLKNYPAVEAVMRAMRGVTCGDHACQYCSEQRDARRALKRWFGYDGFRTFDGEPLQEKAVNAAVKGESILTIFPTGGGKSLTFQIPALMAGEAVKGLTVVISPLQSLMKDQVENLERKGIADAVYINGLLSPIERKTALERVRSGEASLLYIAPESLRSKTIEKIIMERTLVRVVIDEAHCFSAWGQDFRIEYMHIGEFIRDIQAKKGLSTPIPVSCFTATAKPKVISDISDYFRDRLGLGLKRYTTSATRTNLHYTVLYRSDNEKYQTLRSLLLENNCPSIVYVTRTKKAEEVASQLCKDGIVARAFHGQMDTRVKIAAQEAFVENKVRVIVATSAFGMGVDKSDVGLVVHFQISDSLENYIQEAGRAGRDVHSDADCYVLYNDDDLNRHFVLLNQTKLTLSEINQIWRAIKGLTANRNVVQISALEIARKAGWDENKDIETKVKSAISALENAGYVKRGMNSPRIFATSIVPKTMDEAVARIDRCAEIPNEDKISARRIIKSLISERSRADAGTSDAESRVDYLADMLGMETRTVISLVERMRMAGILAQDSDMTAYVRLSLLRRFDLYCKIERGLVDIVTGADGDIFNLKQINEQLLASGIQESNVRDIRTVLFFWMIRNYIMKTALSNEYVSIRPSVSRERFEAMVEERESVARFIIGEFKARAVRGVNEVTVNFSLAELVQRYNAGGNLLGEQRAEIDVVEEALLFLSKTGVVNIQGGFMVLYSRIELERLNMDNRSHYKKIEYKNLDDFYRQKIRQIHIVGKYANMMVSDKDKAMRYVQDYFTMDFEKFIKKYFDTKEAGEISRNVSRKKYDEIFGKLTPVQDNIINDRDSRYIVVPAGPGSGKTFVLVRKLASLILMEDVKSEQLLMLTFSRAAAVEFSARLTALIGNAARYVEIKTFHSYCFDILGKVGTVEDSDDVVGRAVEVINAGKVERSLITKMILVIDEAQDMGADEFALVEALIRANEDMRVIAVGDDDQNIYEFRGSDSRNMEALISKYGATVYNMVDNFRSSSSVISVANAFVRNIVGRLKSIPINCVRPVPGSVRICRHTCREYVQAVVNDVLAFRGQGSVCVLTVTNDDALTVTTLLNKAGRPARLIQSNDGFRMSYLAELHYFLSVIRDGDSVRIGKDAWNAAKSSMAEKFAGSASLDIALRCISSFESAHAGVPGSDTDRSGSEDEDSRTIYLSDFESFLTESKMESFSRSGESEVTVSTIHKAKGREYDNVFMLLRRLDTVTDKERRAVYVGITRAKDNLSIHYDNAGLFGKAVLSLAQCSVDEQDFGQPEEIQLQLTHKDVILDHFKHTDVSAVQSGTMLSCNLSVASPARREPAANAAQGAACAQNQPNSLPVNGQLSRSGGAGDAVTLNFVNMFADLGAGPGVNHGVNPGGKGSCVIRLSSAGRAKLAAQMEKGYSVASASVRFQVYWGYEDSPAGVSGAGVNGSAPDSSGTQSQDGSKPHLQGSSKPRYGSSTAWHEVPILLPDVVMRREK